MTKKHPDHNIVSYFDECLDITGAADIEIKIRADGAVIWINTPFCVLRICQIKGNILIDDEREDAFKRMATLNQEAFENGDL